VIARQRLYQIARVGSGPSHRHGRRPIRRSDSCPSAAGTGTAMMTTIMVDTAAGGLADGRPAGQIPCFSR